MTEDSLVAAIATALEETGRSKTGARALVTGIGDDAAAWRPSRSNLSVVTTDALVDGVHFLSEMMSPEAIGFRAMASNLSDLAAMGARPRLATIALGVPASGVEVDEAWVVSCYRAMGALCARFGATIAGGDIVKSPALMLSITAIGEVAPSRMKLRSGGKPGDVLAVTGALGASRAGLELMRRPNLVVGEEAHAAALAAFEHPQPRVAEGRWLAASTHVRAMMDLSDGLSTDAPRSARASGCGLVLDDIPIHAAATAVASVAGGDAHHYALDGGEDFELLIAIAPRAFKHLATRFESHFGKSLIRIGTLTADPAVLIRQGSETIDLKPAGYDHLSSS